MSDADLQRGELRDTDTGRWLVTTRTSRYVLDLDSRLMTRVPGAGDPRPHGSDSAPPVTAALRRDGRAVPLRSVAQCHLGEPLVVVLDLRGDGVATVRQSTPVVAIELAPAGGS